MRILKLLCLFSLAIFLILSCRKDIGKQLEPANAVVVDSCKTDVTFNSDIKSILNTYCAINSGCHAQNNSWGNFTTYGGFKPKAESGLALSRIKNGEMPPSYSTGPITLSKCEITKLSTWIEEGCQDN